MKCRSAKDSRMLVAITNIFGSLWLTCVLRVGFRRSRKLPNFCFQFILCFIGEGVISKNWKRTEVPVNRE